MRITHMTDADLRALGLERDALPVAKSPKPLPQPTTTFIPPKWYPRLQFSLLAGGRRGATLFGPRGSGKSTAIRELARSTNHKTVTMQCAKNMQFCDLIGYPGIKDGTSSFEEGPLTECIRHGYWLIAEEANVIDPGVWSMVNTLTDKTGDGLRLPTGEEVPNHPDFRLILLFNEGYQYQGTREVNAALKDRLGPIYTDYPEPAIEVQMLQILRPNLPVICLQKIVQCAGMVRAANLQFDMSIRALDTWAHMHEEGLGTWLECFSYAVVDLAGDPVLKAPVRAVLAEIANNCGVGNW